MNNPDPENMLGYIDALADDLEKAWQLGMTLPLPAVNEVSQIVVCGMGGSAIGGDFLASYLADKGSIPILSRRNYGVPAFAQGENTLVICSSHSGNTEETVDSFHAALDQGCKVLVLATGGKLAKLADEHQVPFWRFEHHGQPRTAIPYSFAMLLALAQRLGLCPDQSSAIQAAANAMRAQKEKLTAAVGLNENPAKRLAGQLLERNIIILAAGEFEVIARRWKTQINELAKAWASFEALPEMNHNTLAGLVFPESLYERSSAIFLRAEWDHPRNVLRLDATLQSFLAAGVATDQVWATGEAQLAQMWTLLQFGDYVSYYLALEYGIDPTPVNALETLKKKLAQS